MTTNQDSPVSVECPNCGGIQPESCIGSNHPTPVQTRPETEDERIRDYAEAVHAGLIPHPADMHPRPETISEEGGGPIEHHLKTWPGFFAAVRSGEKTFELRRDDRNFRVGDDLVLQEWSEIDGYSGEVERRTVSYVVRGSHGVSFGLQPGFCVLGFALRTAPQSPDTSSVEVERVIDELVTALEHERWCRACGEDGCSNCNECTSKSAILTASRTKERG